MTEALTCPASSAEEPPACSRRLSVQECVEAWRREARHGEVDTGRYRCRYFSWGRGPTLVFIPGLCSDGPTFVPVMARLRQHFRCVGYDLPTGVADGARLTAYCHDDLVHDLFALLDHLQVRDSSVFGFSFGATIALAALSRQPQRFARAILQGAFARRPLAPAEVFASCWARYLPGTLGRVPWLNHVTRRMQFEPFQARAEDDWRYFLECQGRTPLQAFAQRALLMHRLDLRELLRSVTQPVLLVCGDRDPLVARCYQEELRGRLPCATQAEIEGCGHHPHLSHPEVLAELMRQFLLPSGCSG